MGGSSRLEMLDGLRGFALMGLFLVHAVELFELYWAHPEPGWVHDLVFGLFAGKAFALFALCFGLSFFIIMERAAARGERPGAMFAWRLVLLFLIGTAHSLIYRGDVLQVLALLGLLLIVFDRIRSSRVLLALSAFFLLQPDLLLRAAAAAAGAAWANASPLFWTSGGLEALADGSFREAVAANLTAGQIGKWSFYAETGRMVQTIGLFLAGLALGRAGFFREPEKFVRSRRIAGLAALAVLAALLAARDPVLAAISEPRMTHASVGALLASWISLAAIVVYVVAFVELYQSVARPALSALAPVGRMTLTLYVGQSVVFAPILYGFGLGLHDDITQPQALALGIVAFLAQVVLARLWFERFVYGPLEWVWRAGTRRTFAVPFVRRAPAVEPTAASG